MENKIKWYERPLTGLEVGKTYRNRNTHLVTIVRETRINQTLQYEGKVEGSTNQMNKIYNSDGGFGSYPNPYDLIEGPIEMV